MSSRRNATPVEDGSRRGGHRRDDLGLLDGLVGGGCGAKRRAEARRQRCHAFHERFRAFPDHVKDEHFFQGAHREQRLKLSLGLPPRSEERRRGGVGTGQQFRRSAGDGGGTHLGENRSVQERIHFARLSVQQDHRRRNHRFSLLRVTGEHGDDLDARLLDLLRIGGHEETLPFSLSHIESTPQRHLGSPLRMKDEGPLVRLDGIAHGEHRTYGFPVEQQHRRPLLRRSSSPERNDGDMTVSFTRDASAQTQ